MKVVDVIIPVYKGLSELVRCLESVRACETKVKKEIIVINDCSPEKEIHEYLKAESLKGGISYYENPVNLGFVGTVNRGMRLNTARDVILLNSDTEVYGNWLDRMLEVSNLDARIATVTPFSNNATICSYPKFAQDNKLPPGFSGADIDNLFSKVGHLECVEVPTGVGFCMLIKRSCLNEVGYFDEHTFGKGYGEENDFCMRAQKKGWVNVHSCNVFVYHSGAVSFGESQNARVQDALIKLNLKHPKYSKKIRDYLCKDPARPIRLLADYERLANSDLRKILFVNLNLGGGTEKHVHELADFLHQKAESFELKTDEVGKGVNVKWLNDGEGFMLNFQLPTQYQDLVKFLKSLGISLVHYHHTIGIDPMILNIHKDLKVLYDFTAHDYYTFCPRISLTGVQGSYCGEPSAAECQKCIEKKPTTVAKDINVWREQNSVFLNNANRVFAPSLDAKARVERHFPKVNVLFVPHIEATQKSLDLPVVRRASTGSQAVKVAVIGALDEKKGKNLILEAAAIAGRKELPLEIHVFGYLGGIKKSYDVGRKLILHGPYAGDAALDKMLAVTKPDFAWFPAVWPETFCYTLSAALRNRLPILSSDLGAFPERLNFRAFSAVKSWRLSAEQWVDELTLFSKMVSADTDENVAPQRAAIPSLQGEAYYGENYLMASARVAAVKKMRVNYTLEEIKLHAYPPKIRVSFFRKVILCVLFYFLRFSFFHFLKSRVSLGLRQKIAFFLGYKKS